MSPLIALRTASPPAGDGRADPAHDALSRLSDLSQEFAPDLTLSIHTQFDGIADEWRAFETVAECTGFQTYEWLTTWHRHIGRQHNITPVIAIARYADGSTAMIAPLALERRMTVSRLCWLGQDLSDYNAPLLSRRFAQRVDGARFLALWRELQQRLQAEPALRYDWIDFEKMPQTVGVQTNPFTYLHVTANANSAHITQLAGDWETFYRGKRSSATRRRDRTKRKRIEEFGALRFTTAIEPDDVRGTLDVLWDQKKRIFAHKGIGDIFDRPGYREFFADFATNSQSRHMAHVSRLEIGEQCGAANFALVVGDCYYHVLSSYLGGEVTRFGPGTVHLRELLAYAIKRGLRLFDFTIGDEPYKSEWSDLRLKLYDYSVAANWRGWPWHCETILRRRLKRLIKQTPVLWRAVSRLRSAIGPLIYPQPASPAAAVETEAAEQARSIPACVMGDMDLLQPIKAAGIACSVVARPGAPPLYSRLTKKRLRWDCTQSDEMLVDALTRFGQAHGERPVLFYEEDEQLLFISRHRERLGEAFRFVMAAPSLVEDLTDKARFAELAKRHDLPVPQTVRFNPATVGPADIDLDFPIIIKPLTRVGRWNETFGMCKALAAANREALRQMWPQLQALDSELLAQRLIRGDETRIESYHCYIDAGGTVAGEFTGRKIRTFPMVYGHTTALEITDAADVKRQGRAAAERLGLTGVAKFDFKRDAGGTLHLLEINPRFTLWHHAGAVAGVNIPALVYADLTGTRRPRVGPVKAGVRWCRIWKDLPAARQSGVPLAAWLPWVLRCEAKSALSWSDPMPLIGAGLHTVTERLTARLSARGEEGDAAP